MAARSGQIQPRQKALQQMNLGLTQVLSDITGQSGLAILAAILKGERDPLQLAALADPRVKATPATLAQALVGDYRAEHLFVLRTAFELYHTYEEKIAACEQQIVAETARLPERVDPVAKPLPARKEGRPAYQDKMQGQDLREPFYRRLGVDLTAIEGIGIGTALVILTEVGPDLGRFPSEKHFASWLGLSPDNRISGGRVLTSRTRKVKNRASEALRMAASSLERSQSALGGFFRRMKARLGPASAITATAHKLARIIYRLLKYGEAYVQKGLDAYEKEFQRRKLAAVKKMAASLGLELVAKKPFTV